MPSETSETRYARSGDVNIAYQVVGEGPFDLVYVPGLDLEHRADVGGAQPCPPPRAARLLLAAHPVRQARHWDVRSGADRPAADARAEDGRRPRRHGRRRFGTRRAVR